MVLVGLAGQEPIEAVEAAAEGPALPGRPHRHLRRRCQVPLADGERGVAVAGEDLGQEPVGLGHRGVVAGEPGGELDDPRHAAGVVVATGEQAGARRRAQRGRVEVAVAQPARGEAVERRRGDVRAEAAELGVPDVVEQHHHHVRRAGRRRRQRRPPRRRVVQRAPDDALELLRLHPDPFVSTAIELYDRIRVSDDRRPPSRTLRWPRTLGWS